MSWTGLCLRFGPRLRISQRCFWLCHPTSRFESRVFSSFASASGTCMSPPLSRLIGPLDLRGLAPLEGLRDEGKDLVDLIPDRRGNLVRQFVHVQGGGSSGSLVDHPSSAAAAFTILSGNLPRAGAGGTVGHGFVVFPVPLAPSQSISTAF